MKRLFMLTAVLLTATSSYAQGTESTLKCSGKGGLDLHASRDPGSPVIARVPCGATVLVIDNRFGSAHLRTEDGKDGYVTELNLGEYSFTPVAAGTPASAIPKSPSAAPAASVPLPSASRGYSPVGGSEKRAYSRLEIFGGYSLILPSSTALSPLNGFPVPIQGGNVNQCF